MKTKTSMKLTWDFKNVYKTGYCNLQTLLTGKNPDYYNAGYLGWNCDLYIIDIDTILTTGYSNMRGESIPYDVARKYEIKARKIMDRRGWKYETRLEKVAALRNEFFEKLNNGEM